MRALPGRGMRSLPDPGRRLQVVCANGLSVADKSSNKSDPYCKVFWNRKPLLETTVKVGALDPVWDEHTGVPDVGAHAVNQLIVEVYDSDEFDDAAGDFLGRLVLRGPGVAGLPCGEPRTFALQPDAAKSSNSLVQVMMTTAYDHGDDDGVITSPRCRARSLCARSTSTRSRTCGSATTSGTSPLSRTGFRPPSARHRPGARMDEGGAANVPRLTLFYMKNPYRDNPRHCTLIASPASRHGWDLAAARTSRGGLGVGGGRGQGRRRGRGR